MIHSTNKSHPRQKVIAGLIKPYLKGKVLDVGCGDTLVAKYTKHKNIFGIDVVKPNKAYIPFQLFDGQHIPFKDKQFDTVISSFVIHHAKNPSILISEMVRVGNRLIVLEDKYESLTNVLSVQSLHCKLLFKYGLPYNPFGFHSKKKWLSIFKGAGLNLNRARKCPKLYPWPGLEHYLFVLD